MLFLSTQPFVSIDLSAYENYFVAFVNQVSISDKKKLEKKKCRLSTSMTRFEMYFI